MSSDALPIDRMFRDHYTRLSPVTVVPLFAETQLSSAWLVTHGRDTKPSFVAKRTYAGNADARRRYTLRTRLYNDLATNQLPVVRLVPLDNGEPALADGDYVFTVFEMVTSDSEVPISISETARRLAMLHQYMSSIQLALPRDSDYSNLNDEEIATGISNADRLEDKELVVGLRSVLERIHELYSEEAILTSAEPTAHLYHADMHPGNVIQSRTGPIICDLDSIVSSRRPQAVAFAASRLSPEDPSRFIEAYETVSPLAGNEYLALSSGVRREAIERLNWLVRRNLVRGRSEWMADFAKHINAIEKWGPNSISAFCEQVESRQLP